MRPANDRSVAMTATLSAAMAAALGQATVGNDTGEFRLVPAGTCKQLKGLSEAQARARLTP